MKGVFLGSLLFFIVLSFLLTMVFSIQIAIGFWFGLFTFEVIYTLIETRDKK